MSTFVPLLSREQISQLPKRAREVVEYRKSGLSLNHIQGCPLDCAYCIRHTYGIWDQRQPRALMTDAEAVEQLVSHRYFQPHVTPVQVFNRATDPFLPNVRPHTLAVLDLLDSRGLTNHVLVITRHQMKPEDIERLNQLRHLKVTLLFTFSGIDNKQIEPYPSHVAAESLKLMSAPEERRYRTILYWRPLVPGLNDTDEHLDRAYELSQHADATVFTGLFYRDQIAEYYKANGLPEPYDDTARRKIVPETLERRVLTAFSDSTSLFRKTVVLWPTHTASRTTTVTTASASCAISARSVSLNCAPAPTTCRRPTGFGRSPARCRRLVVWWSWTSPSGPPWCRDWRPSSRATTCNTRSAFRYTTRAGRTMSGGTDAPTSDGRANKQMADWTDLNYAVVDVEGNGQQPPELVELAIVPIVGGVIGEPVSWLVRPAEPIKYFATRIHGLTNKDVADAPEFAAISDEVLHTLDGAVLVAHNAHVDVDVLGRKLGGDWQRPEVFDTLKLARRLVPGQDSYRLGTRQVLQTGREAARRSDAAPRHLRRAGHGPAVCPTRHPRPLARRTAR